MARIGLDLDGVCYKFVDAFRSHLFFQKGIPLEKMPPATRWEFYEDWGFSLAEYKSLIVDGTKYGDLFWKGDMYEGCKEVIDYLYHVRQDEIVFVTSRSIKTQPNLAEYATFYWLNDVAGLPYHELILTDDKFGLGLDVLFDDAPYQFEKHENAGEHGVIFDQPWNWHVAHAPRVYGWTGVLNYVKEKFPSSVTKM
jgi:5'(3')-deoxyribonucleotidase